MTEIWACGKMKPVNVWCEAQAAYVEEQTRKPVA